MTDIQVFTHTKEFQVPSQPVRLTLSDQGDYLIVRTKSGELLYYNRHLDLLWSGKTKNSMIKMAISSDRQRVVVNYLVNNTYTTYAFDKTGKPLWGYTPVGWQVQDLYLNGSQPIIAATKQHQVANLGSRGTAEWTHSATEPTKIVAIGTEGDVVVYGTEKTIGCLSEGGSLRWRRTIDAPITHLHVGRDRIVGSDKEGKVFCLDVENGRLLADYDFNEAVHGITISGSGNTKRLAVATGNVVRIMLLKPWSSIHIIPVPEAHTGLSNAITTFPASEVQDMHLSASNDCIVVDGEGVFACYSLEGELFWRCKRVPDSMIRDLYQPHYKRSQPRKPRPKVSKPKPTRKWTPVARTTGETETPEIRLIREVQAEFVRYTEQKGQFKSPNLKTRTDVTLDSDVLDLYYDGRGYLFEHKITERTLSKAIRLADHTDIFIISYYASPQILKTIKSMKHVELFRLSDMVKTSGGLFGGKNEFEKFAEVMFGKQFHKK